MKTAIIDIDNVVADTMTSINRWRAHQGINRKLPPAWRWDMTDYSIEDRQYVQRLFLNASYYRQMLPLQGAIPALHFLRDYYNLVFITARACLPNTTEEEARSIQHNTLEWMEEWQLPYNALVFQGDKAGYVKEKYDLGEVAFAVDDSPASATSYLALPLLTYVVDYPYNRSAGGTRVRNLHQVLEYQKLRDKLPLADQGTRLEMVG